MKLHQLTASLIIITALVTSSFASNHKRVFIEKIVSDATVINQQLLKQRNQLLIIQQKQQQGGPLSVIAQRQLQKIAQSYKVTPTPSQDNHQWPTLLKRVDIIPLSLVVSQAAIESGWGQSRFAKQGHNYFGQQCYRQGCGIKPLRVSQTSKVQVRIFKNRSQSIKAYMHNLNTNKNYLKLRQLRHDLRQKKLMISGITLAQGLINYAEIKERYIRIIQRTIKANQLEKLDQPETQLAQN